MPQVTRQICTGCGESIYNVMVNGVRVPIVAQIVVGQPNDTGPLVNINAPDLAIPSVVRELMATPVARIELCMNCFGAWIGQPLVTPQLDPMAGVGQMPVLPTMPGVIDDRERFAIMHERVLYAAEVAQGKADAPEGQRLLRQAAEFEAYLEPDLVDTPIAEAAPEPAPVLEEAEPAPTVVPGSENDPALAPS